MVLRYEILALTPRWPRLTARSDHDFTSSARRIHRRVPEDAVNAGRHGSGYSFDRRFLIGIRYTTPKIRQQYPSGATIEDCTNQEK